MKQCLKNSWRHGRSTWWDRMLETIQGFYATTGRDRRTDISTARDSTTTRPLPDQSSRANTGSPVQRDGALWSCSTKLPTETGNPSRTEPGKRESTLKGEGDYNRRVLYSLVRSCATSNNRAPHCQRRKKNGRVLPILVFVLAMVWNSRKNNRVNRDIPVYVSKPIHIF